MNRNEPQESWKETDENQQWKQKKYEEKIKKKSIWKDLKPHHVGLQNLPNAALLGRPTIAVTQQSAEMRRCYIS